MLWCEMNLRSNSVLRYDGSRQSGISCADSVHQCDGFGGTGGGISSSSGIVGGGGGGGWWNRIYKYFKRLYIIFQGKKVQ